MELGVVPGVCESQLPGAQRLVAAPLGDEVQQAPDLAALLCDPLLGAGPQLGQELPAADPGRRAELHGKQQGDRREQGQRPPRRGIDQDDAPDPRHSPSHGVPPPHQYAA
jgi:hypothetical protein